MLIENEELNKLNEDVKAIFDVITSSQLQEKLFAFKIIFIVISIFLFALIIYYAIKSSYLDLLFIKDYEELSSWKNYGQSKSLKKWERIKKRLKKDSQSQYKLALVEAAKLLEETMKKIGDDKTELGDKLEELGINHIYQNIKDNPEYKLNKTKAEEVINIFEKTLKELQAF